MSQRNPYRAINFPGGSAFERPFPVDARTEAIAEELTQLPGAIESGLLLRGAASTYQTLRPGIATYPAMGEIILAGATRDEIIEFKMRQLVRRDLARSGMTLAALMFSAESGKITEFSITGINGYDPRAEYVDIDGYLDDAGDLQVASLPHAADGTQLGCEQLEPTAAVDFVRSIRDFSATPEPITDSIDDELFALFSGAENRLVIHSGSYVFEEEQLEIFAEHSTLHREGKQPLVNYTFEAQETKSNPTLDTQRAHLFSIKRGNTKRDRPTYQARFGMSIHDTSSPEERASSYEQTSMHFLKHPKEFYASLGRIAALFADPFRVP